MNDLRKAAEMALEAFEMLDKRGGLGLDVHEYIRTKIEALRQALAQPEQEPEWVATIGNWGKVQWREDVFPHLGAKLYSAPPQEAIRQALAHEALDRMVAENQRLGLYDDGPAVKTYAGGKPNYCTPEVTPEVTPDVDNAYTKLDTTAGVLHKEWVGLTNEDIDDLWKTEYFNVHYELPRAIEAKLKEKNT